jgi:hypothetical protein
VFPLFATDINNTRGIGGKFAAGVIDTGGKFSTCVVDTGSKFSASVIGTGGKFAACVIDMMVSFDLQISP